MASSGLDSVTECSLMSARERVLALIVLGYRHGTERASQGYWARLWRESVRETMEGYRVGPLM